MNKFEELKETMPQAEFGDGIDWSKALLEGVIKPKKSLNDEYFQSVVIKTKL